MNLKNLIFILIWFIVSIVAGVYLGLLFCSSYQINEFWFIVFVNFCCVTCFALFSLPFLNRVIQ